MAVPHASQALALIGSAAEPDAANANAAPGQLPPRLGGRERRERRPRAALSLPAFGQQLVPGYKIALEQPTGWKKLLASELTGAGPASPLDQDGIVAERQEVDRSAQRYLLDHGLPAEKYLEALDAVEAGRDRAEPVAPLRRPAPMPVKDEGMKLLDNETADLVARANDYCEQRGWSTGGEAFMKAVDAVLADHGMPD
jgi:hypothetical protein